MCAGKPENWESLCAHTNENRISTHLYTSTISPLLNIYNFFLLLDYTLHFDNERWRQSSFNSGRWNNVYRFSLRATNIYTTQNTFYLIFDISNEEKKRKNYHTLIASRTHSQYCEGENFFLSFTYRHAV